MLLETVIEVLPIDVAMLRPPMTSCASSLTGAAVAGPLAGGFAGSGSGVRWAPFPLSRESGSVVHGDVLFQVSLRKIAFSGSESSFT